MSDETVSDLSGQILGTQIAIVAVLKALDSKGLIHKEVKENLRKAAGSLVDQQISDPEQISMFYEAAQAMNNVAMLIEQGESLEGN